MQFTISIVALRNEKGSYNAGGGRPERFVIVALRNEKGSYNRLNLIFPPAMIVALRNEKGSYNRRDARRRKKKNCSTAK